MKTKLEKKIRKYFETQFDDEMGKLFDEILQEFYFARCSIFHGKEYHRQSAMLEETLNEKQILRFDVFKIFAEQESRQRQKLLIAFVLDCVAQTFEKEFLKKKS